MVNVVSAVPGLNALGYITIIIALILVASTTYFIVQIYKRKEKITPLIVKSIIITLIIEIVLGAIGLFTGVLIAECKPGGHCQGPFELLMIFSLFITIPLFLIVLFIVSLIKCRRIFRNKSQ